MRTIQRTIDGPFDFELGRSRTSPLEYTADFPTGRALGLVFVIPGFGGDTNDGYAEALRRHIVSEHEMAAVSVRYHCFGARPDTGGKIQVDDHDLLMLLGMAHFAKTPLGDLSDVNDVARRLAATGVAARVGATIHPARDEYQNFGVVQAMDHLAVLGDLLRQEAEFDATRIVALGSSHGGYIAHMMAKIAPRTLAMVIDNSSYTQPPMEYLGQPASAEYIAPLAGEVMAFCRTKSGWTTDNRQAPHFYSRDRDLIRDVAYPPHLAATKSSAGDDATIFRMVNASTDSISPPHMKERQAAAQRAFGFDSQLSLITDENLDGRVFKQLVHGLDASLASLFDMAIVDLRPRSGPCDAVLGAIVAYECVDSNYQFTHSSAAPFISGEVKSRFFEDA